MFNPQLQLPNFRQPLAKAAAFRHFVKAFNSLRIRLMTPSSRIPALLRHYFVYKMTFLCIVFKDRCRRFSVFAVLATTLMIIAPPP